MSVKKNRQSRQDRFESIRTALTAAAGFPKEKQAKQEINRRAWSLSNGTAVGDEIIPAHGSASKRNKFSLPPGVSPPPGATIVKKRNPASYVVTPVGTLTNGMAVGIIGETSLAGSGAGWVSVHVAAPDRTALRFGWNGSRFSRCRASESLSVSLLDEIRAMVEPVCA